jgi:hypothetical protein
MPINLLAGQLRVQMNKEKLLYQIGQLKQDTNQSFQESFSSRGTTWHDEPYLVLQLRELKSIRHFLRLHRCREYGVSQSALLL